MSGCILIADEAANNRIFLIASLSAAGYEVKEACGPDQLWAYLDHNTPDLVIMDAEFGNTGRLEICRKLSAISAPERVPVIIVASDFDRQTRLEALRAGADEIVPRPINEHFLRARIRNLLRTRTLMTEMAQRESTAQELGFAESAAAFAPPKFLLAIEGSEGLPDTWKGVTEKYPNMRAEFTRADRALDDIERLGLSPEMIVLAPGLHLQRQGMTLIAELRTRTLTRHAAIMVTHAPAERLAAVAALDLGANDLVEADSTAAEIKYRMRTQLNFQEKSARLRSTLERGLELAATDPLTGLFNRRYAMPHLLRIARAACEKQSPFAVMALDLDHFKRINDEYGHSAGDKVLVDLSDRLRQNLRSVDMVARIGGEEFLVVMPDTGLEAARGAAERLRRLAEATPVLLPGNAGHITVTMSIGVAMGGMDSQNQTAVERIVDLADRALLQAKSDGRNTVNLGRMAA